MAAAFTSLDIEERQILLYFENDAIPWHHRVPTLQIEGPKWICATPDLEVQSVNLLNKDIRALARNAEIPVDCRPVYMFDPIDDADMQSIRAESRRLAEVLGVADELPTAVSHDANQIFSDPAHESFGLLVPDGILAGQARFVVRGSFALMQVEVGDGSSWTVAENVARVDKDAWLNEKHCGPGRDPRLAPTPTNDGKIVILRDQLRHLVDQPMPRWAFKGPRAIVELLMQWGCSQRARAARLPAVLAVDLWRGCQEQRLDRVRHDLHAASPPGGRGRPQPGEPQLGGACCPAGSHDPACGEAVAARAGLRGPRRLHQQHLRLVRRRPDDGVRQVCLRGPAGRCPHHEAAPVAEGGGGGRRPEEARQEGRQEEQQGHSATARGGVRPPTRAN